MKKLTLFTFLCFTVIYSAHAQKDFDPSELRFGFQISPSFGWLNTTTSQINNSGTNLGLKLGMLTEYYFTGDKRYAFSTGIGFAFNSGGTLLHENGGSYWTRSELGSNLDTLPAGVKLKYNIQYLEIPAGLKMRFEPSSSRDLGIFLEPAITFGFKTRAQGEITGTGIGEQDDKIDIRKEVNGLNLSWGISGGIEYALSSTTSLIGGLGFQAGFTDVTDDNGTVFEGNNDTSREDSKGTANQIIVKIGILF